MKNTFLKLTMMVLLGLLSIKCKKDDIQLKQVDGYIVGFDPCTVNQHYKIGYVIISSDLADTLITYNLSDATFQMPASVMLSPSDTLYKIPELYFQNFRNSGYFPLTVHTEFKIKVAYAYATEEQKIYNLCTTDINQTDFNNALQVIIKSATKQ